jgi:pimeloyl-ACP methyl ester carboxylesterase
MLKKFLLLILISCCSHLSLANMKYQSIPATPTLPSPVTSGYAPIHGMKIWYAIYGKGEPVIFLHGGLANSDYWGYQVPVISKQYKVIVMDTRSHGRSSGDGKPLNYHLMAEDVIALMDRLKIRKASIVGWSDGAIIGIDLAIHHHDRLNKVFAFGANSDPSGTKDNSTNPTWKIYATRVEKEYQQYSKIPGGFKTFFDSLIQLWSSQPHFSKAELGTIHTPIWIVDGDHDEGIKREDTEFLADNIPNAGLLFLPNLSHFAFLQDPSLFNFLVLHFLNETE